MAESNAYKTFLSHNKDLLTKFVAITNRLAVKVIKDYQADRVGNFFVIFHDSFAKYFGNKVIILNGVAPETLMVSFRRILGDVIGAGAWKKMNLWFITQLD